MELSFHLSHMVKAQVCINNVDAIQIGSINAGYLHCGTLSKVMERCNDLRRLAASQPISAA